MRVGIVGSRRRNSSGDRAQVEIMIDVVAKEYGDDLVIVSGGCQKGADKFAASYCNEMDIKLVEHLPDVANVKDYGDRVQRYYARNRKIAQDSDFIVAFVALDRTGGTENTIKHAKELGKPVIYK